MECLGGVLEESAVVGGLDLVFFSDIGLRVVDDVLDRHIFVQLRVHLVNRLDDLKLNLLQLVALVFELG